MRITVQLYFGQSLTTQPLNAAKFSGVIVHDRFASTIRLRITHLRRRMNCSRNPWRFSLIDEQLSAAGIAVIDPS